MTKPTSKLSGFLMAATVLLVFDFGLAQVARQVFPWWGGRNEETSYRIRSPLYHHDLAKNISVRSIWGSISYETHTNNLGFRDKKVREVPLKSDKKRLLLIGDSFTEGLGVVYSETFASRIESQLAGQGIETLNAGVTSYSPAIYYRKLKFLIEKAKLDIDEVVVFIDISDIPDEALKYRLNAEDRVVGLQDEQPAEESLTFIVRAKSFLRQNSLTVRLGDILKDRLDLQDNLTPRRLGLNMPESMWAFDDAAFAEHGRLGLELAQANMDKLLALLRQNDIWLGIVVYPWPDQIIRRDSDSVQASVWREWANGRKVPIFDLFPAFLADGDARETIARYFIPYDNHWNEAGHRFIAESFLERYTKLRRSGGVR